MWGEKRNEMQGKADSAWPARGRQPPGGLQTELGHGWSKVTELKDSVRKWEM